MSSTIEAKHALLHCNVLLKLTRKNSSFSKQEHLHSVKRMTMKINDSRKLVFVGTRGDAGGGRKGHKKEELSCWEHTQMERRREEREEQKEAKVACNKQMER